MPDELKFKGALKLDEAWKGIAFSLWKTKKDKQAVTLGIHNLFAILPCIDPARAAVDFVLEPANFDSVAEHGQAIIGAANSFRQAPPLSELRASLLRNIQEAYDALEAGGPHAKFLETVRYAEIARKAFAEDTTVQQLATIIFERRDWIEETRRTLQSLVNNGNWDSFLQNYIPFERYQRSFPELEEARRKAFEESARFHVQLGKSLAQQKKFQEAYQELRLAQSRDPGNEAIASLVESVRLDASAAIARERAPLRKSLPPDSPQAIQFNRHLEFATMFIADKKLKEAYQELSAAEEMDKDSPRILLVRARYFLGTDQLAKANETLDAYDAAVITAAERAAGEEVRVKVLYGLKSLKKDYRDRLETLLQAGRYSEAYELSVKALELDAQDENILNLAATLAAVMRRTPAAVAHLQKYLEVSNSLRADPKDREKAARLLALLQSPRPVSAEGQPNWLSGRKLPPEIFYCPESAALQPRIDSIRFHKTDVQFHWMPDRRLSRIETRFEEGKAKPDFLAAVSASFAAFKGVYEPFPVDIAPGNLYFEYFPNSPQVGRVAHARPPDSGGQKEWKVVVARGPAGDLRFAEESAGEARPPREKRAFLWHYPVLLSNPYLDPDVVAFLGNPATLAVAGNSVFSPFLWDGIHLFRTTHDRLGRLQTAREIGLDNLVRFEWDGDRLLSIAAYAGAAPVYRRTMTYENRRLVAETATLGAKTGKTTYVYEGGKLLEASVNDPAAQDDHERRVRFLP